MITRLKNDHEVMGKDIGLLLFRVGISALMLSHGIPKLMNFSERAATFADPLGVGPQASLALAVFAEVVCAILVIGGLVTRFAASQLVITMIVAAFIVHGDHPFKKQELALVYAVGYLALMLTGAGRFSIDQLVFKRKEEPASGSDGNDASVDTSSG